MGSIDGREERAHDADAVGTDDIDFHARLVQCAQHAGMVGAGGAGAGQNESGSSLRRVRVRGLNNAAIVHSAASSWMVKSLRISNSRVPPGVTTFTESPGSLFRNARPIGDVVEIKPLVASASSGMTS